MRREAPKTNKTVTDFNDVGSPNLSEAGWGTSLEYNTPHTKSGLITLFMLGKAGGGVQGRENTGTRKGGYKSGFGIICRGTIYRTLTCRLRVVHWLSLSNCREQTRTFTQFLCYKIRHLSFCTFGKTAIPYSEQEALNYYWCPRHGISL